MKKTLPWREGTATRGLRLSTEHCQSFFINATSKLVTKSQATRDWLINIPIESPNFQVLVRKWNVRLGISDETFQSYSF